MQPADSLLMVILIMHMLLGIIDVVDVRRRWIERALKVHVGLTPLSSVI